MRETMKADPFSGAVYVFRAKRADRVKLIYWDGTGVCLFAKRLEDGKFRWPNVQDGVMRLSAAELSALLEGLDWKRVHAARETPAPISLHDCGTVNQRGGNARDAARRMIYSRAMTADALPDDPGTLKAMLIAERAQNERLRQIIKELQRHRFGRRAETLPDDQMLLGLEDVEQAAAGDEAKIDAANPAERASRSAKRRLNRGSLPAHLPRIEMVVDS